MDISCRLNPNQSFIFPIKTSFRKPSKINMISCRASTLEAQKEIGDSNFYEILSLESQTVGFEEIKKAYRSMARQYHPDVVPASRKEESTKKFVKLQQAYETLSNPISRQKYDFELGYLSRCGSPRRRRSQDCSVDFGKDVWEDQLSGLAYKSNNNNNNNKSQKRKGACV